MSNGMSDGMQDLGCRQGQRKRCDSGPNGEMLDVPHQSSQLESRTNYGRSLDKSRPISSLQDHWTNLRQLTLEVRRRQLEDEVRRNSLMIRYRLEASSMQSMTVSRAGHTDSPTTDRPANNDQLFPTFVYGGAPLEPNESLFSRGSAPSAWANSLEGEDYHSNLRYSSESQQVVVRNRDKSSQESASVRSPNELFVDNSKDCPRLPGARFRRVEGVAMVQPTDGAILTRFQLLVRKSLALFEVEESDVLLGHYIRKPEVGQVGIRCRYCEHRPPHRRRAGAVYFPGRMSAVYQAAQNIASNHLIKTCTDVPPSVRKEMIEEKMKLKREPRRSGGNSYWVETIRHLGVEDRADKKGMWVTKHSRSK